MCVVKYSEEGYVEQYRVRPQGSFSMRTRGEVCKSVTWKKAEVQKPSFVYEDNQGAIFQRRIGKLVCVPGTLKFVTVF